MMMATACASKTELDAYGDILNNLAVLELQSGNPGETEVTETIRAHLLQMLDGLTALCQPQ